MGEPRAMSTDLTEDCLKRYGSAPNQGIAIGAQFKAIEQAYVHMYIGLRRRMKSWHRYNPRST